MSESAKWALWRERVLAFERSGLQRGVWCARAGIKVATLDYWRNRFAADSIGLQQRLIPIEVKPVAASMGSLRIELGGGVCLQASADVDAVWLAALLRGLR